MLMMWGEILAQMRGETLALGWGKTQAPLREDLAATPR
jgi:hypothetical protein